MTPYSEQDMVRAGVLVEAAYREAGRDLDHVVIIWGGRIQADAPELGYDKSITKHEQELRAELGLPPKVTPGNLPQHVPAGPPSLALAKSIVFATAAEFPRLLRVFDTDEDASAAMKELTLRTIWHLRLAGFAAARQMNPSGVLSLDKVCVQIPQGFSESLAWQCVDIASIGFAGQATVVRFTPIDGAHPVAESGIPDAVESLV